MNAKRRRILLPFHGVSSGRDIGIDDDDLMAFAFAGTQHDSRGAAAYFAEIAYILYTALNFCTIPRFCYGTHTYFATATY